MRTLQTRLVVLALVFGATPAIAEMKVLSEGKSAIQIMTDEYIVHSDAIGRDFIVEVARPDGLLPSQKTAVIYATDGGFGLVGPMSRTLMADGKIPKVHVVSIGYPNEKGRHAGPRQLDLTHGHLVFEGREVDGVGDKFEAFILDDVRPFIEARYPIDSMRSVLFGHSMGGLFVANVLLRKPEAFAGYLIGGLPIVGDPSLLEKAKVVAPQGNGRRIFIGYCPNDVQRLRADEFTAPISAPNSTFKVLAMNFVDEKHNSEIPMLINKGFRFLLPTDGSDRNEISLKADILERYVGTYRIGPNQSVAVTRDGKHLYASLTRGPQTTRVEIFPESETKFFARDAFAQAEFNVTGNGKADSVLVTVNEAVALAARVE